MCSSAGESGEAFVWLDAEGRRLFGTNTGFWGGTHLARDLGPKTDPDTVAYTFISGERDHDNDSIEVRAIHADGKLSPAAKITFPLEWKKNGKLPQFKDNAEAYGANGLAVRNGIAVFTITRQDRVVFADVHTRKILGEDRAASPRSLLFDGQGRLLMVAGTGVVRFDTPDLAARGWEKPPRLSQKVWRHRAALHRTVTAGFTSRTGVADTRFRFFAGGKAIENHREAGRADARPLR